MKVAVVGATGVVGHVMSKVLNERNFPVDEFFPVASERSVGKNIIFNNEPHKVIGMQEAIDKKPDIALFSAGGDTSLKWAPKFAKAGTTVIDNSSAWRMHKDVPLIVPEINADILTKEHKIIANPNCSTIQLAVVLAPIHRLFGIKRAVVSTYQSVTGSGIKAIEQLEAERKGKNAEKAYPHAIDMNCLPHCDVFLENGYTKEEMKVVNETHKIIDPAIAITCTAVRVPVKGGHSEAVNLELLKQVTSNEIKQILQENPSIIVLDEPEQDIYPMPILSEGKDEVFVGRIRQDASLKNAINLWIVADNLRKGAATNAVQIAEYLLSKKLI